MKTRFLSLLTVASLIQASCDGFQKRTPAINSTPAVSNSANSSQGSAEQDRPTRRSTFASAKTVFDKKRICAEEGRAYFAGLKLSKTSPDNIFNVGGPILAYNAALDTCLCEYFVTDYTPSLKSRSEGGWIDDIFANYPVAQFHLRSEDGHTYSDGMMSREEFQKRENELMGIR